MAPADPKKCLKTQESQIGIHPEFFSCKETVLALQYLCVQLLYQKTRIVRFLKSFLNLFFEWASFYVFEYALKMKKVNLCGRFTGSRSK